MNYDLFKPETVECRHETVTFTYTPNLIHHGREDCQTCGKFLRWVSKPETIAQRKANLDACAMLWKGGKLTQWERGFVMSVEKQAGKLSPKQHDTLNKIVHGHTPHPTEDAGEATDCLA